MFELERYRPERGIIVIFGASGDLTRRKLVPALYNLARQNLLPDGTVVVGYGRTEMTDEAFRNRLGESVSTFSRTQPIESDVWNALARRMFYQQGSYDGGDAYPALHRRLLELDEQFATGGNRIFYLAVPPGVVPAILQNLSSVGSLERRRRCDEGTCYLRVVFEKPFGHDLESARRLSNEIDRLLEEPQIFRMDHYLGKETVQNISVLRFANSIFEHVWHSESVRYVRVTVAETLGVEGRGGYFDSTGILRGQYGRGVVNGVEVPAYREEEGVDPNSATETFVGLRTYIDNWRWAGVPVYLCAGKRLAQALTEVSIEFKEAPRVLFGAMKGVELKPNRLTLRIQPDEGVSLRFASKVPGLKMELRDVEMDFPYGSAFPAASPEAYERLLLDVMGGNSSLFARHDEVELAWQFATGILEGWQKQPPPEFPNYAPGTWGPVSAERFFAEDTPYADAGDR